MELIHSKSIEWSEVFLIWEKAEADLPHWVEHYKKRGFATWKDWRSNTVRDLHPEQLRWSLYEIIDPLESVPKFHAGPFRAWEKKYYAGSHTISFAQLATIPEVQGDKNIRELIAGFPERSTIIGLKWGEDIIIIEGLHRCLAVAVAKEREIPFGVKIDIMLADFDGDLPSLGQADSPT